MKFAHCVSAAAVLALAAGSAMAQLSVNGRLKPEYGPIQWVNTTPTQFGNAGVAVAPACDPIGGKVRIALNNSSRAGILSGTGAADQQAAAAVVTGYELKIPLEALGLDITSGGANLPDPVVVRVAGWVGSADYSSISNQFIGGLGGISATTPPNNYPNPRSVDLTTVPNNQFVTATIPRATLVAMLAGSEPIVDGAKDGTYGAALFIQDTQSNYGDAITALGGTDTVFRCQGGSEIDGVYAQYGKDSMGEPALYLMLTGNFESNYNKVALFFDSKTGGQNQLSSDSATQTGMFGSIFSGGANSYGTTTGIGAQPGLKFDVGFAADYFLGFSVGGGSDANPTIFADWQRLRTGLMDGGSARFIGQTQATTNGGVLTASDPCPPFVEPDYHDVANGSEIDGLYATVCGGYLYVLVTGNLQNNGNRLDLFFDVGTVTVPLSSVGQNRLGGNEHPFDFGHLNRLGTDAANPITGPGLQFSAGFAPDYWISMENTGSSPSVNVVTHAGLINALGASNDGAFPAPAYLEYGGIAGGAKATNNPLVFDGLKCNRFDIANVCAPNGLGSGFNPASIPGIDIQGDINANGLPIVLEPYTSFAPRLISADVFNPLSQTVSGFPAPVPANRPSLAVSGLLSTSIDNSNFAGVTDVSAAGAGSVTTGMEVKIRLDELGYGGTGPIKVTGFIVSQDHSFISNQVIGGTLPVGQGNLGEPRTVDFQGAGLVGGGPFYVTINPGTCTAATTGVCCRGATCSIQASAACVVASGAAGARFVTGNACNAVNVTTTPCCHADYNKTAGITVNDIFDFLGDWFAGSVYAKTNTDGSPGPLSVQNIFDFLGDWFAGGC